MATLQKRILGKPTGAVGDINFRNINGNTVITERPAKYTMPMDEESVARRAKFALTAKFAIAVNRIMPVKKLWLMLFPERKTAVPVIFKENFESVGAAEVFESASLVPKDTGFGITTTDVSVSSSSVSVTIDPIGTNAGINLSYEKYAQLCVVIKCTSPVAVGSKSIRFISVVSDRIPLNLASSLQFTADLSSQGKTTFEAYDSHYAYMAILTLDEFGFPVHYSAGFAS